MLKCPLDGHKQTHVHAGTDTRTHGQTHQHTPLTGCGEQPHTAGDEPAAKVRDNIPSAPGRNTETTSPAHERTNTRLLCPPTIPRVQTFSFGEPNCCSAKKPFLILSSSSGDAANKHCPAQPGSLGAFWTSMTLPWVVTCCHGPT